MLSIREKLETDERIIFEAKPPFRSLVIPIIFLFLFVIYTQDVFSFLLISLFVIFNFYYEEFFVTNKRIITRDLCSNFTTFKQINLEDVKYVANLKIPSLFPSTDWILISQNKNGTSAQADNITCVIYSKDFKDKLISYIQSIENNSLNQELADKITFYDSLKSIIFGSVISRFYGWIWKNRKWSFYVLIILGIFLGVADYNLNNKQVSKDLSDLSYKSYKECNVATYNDFSILLPKQINSDEAVYQTSTLENLAYSLEKATNDKLIYIDIRNPDDVYVQMKNMRFRIGDLKSKKVYNKIEKVAFVIPEAMKIKDKINYIDLTRNNISIKLIKEGQSHNPSTIKQICKEPLEF